MRWASYVVRMGRGVYSDLCGNRTKEVTSDTQARMGE